MEFEFFKNFDFSFLTTYSLGGVTDVPKMDIAKSTGYTSSRALIDDSYFAVKNITLGYTVPTTAARRIGASKIRIYGTLDNYLLLSHLDGMNPQYNFAGYTSQVIAPQKTAVLGLNITF